MAQYSAALTRIYDNLISGEQYGSISYYRDDYPGPEAGKPYFWYNITYSSPTASNKYFHYRNYGSSAIESTKKELKWLINNIFGCNARQFEKRYITKSEFERRSTEAN